MRLASQNNAALTELLKRELDKHEGETEKKEWHFYPTDKTIFHDADSLTVKIRNYVSLFVCNKYKN